MGLLHVSRRLSRFITYHRFIRCVNLLGGFSLYYATRRSLQFLSQIATRLRPNGYLISSDLSADPSTDAYQNLLKIWLGLFQLPAEQIEKMRPVFSQNVAVLPPREVESMIESSGFDRPVLFFQTLLLHAWYAKRSSLS